MDSGSHNTTYINFHYLYYHLIPSFSVMAVVGIDFGTLHSLVCLFLSFHSTDTDKIFVRLVLQDIVELILLQTKSLIVARRTSLVFSCYSR